MGVAFGLKELVYSSQRETNALLQIKRSFRTRGSCLCTGHAAHFLEDALPRVLALIKASGLTALVHPLTDDDLADHTSLALWIGEPLFVDHSVLDPRGMNQGIARFGKSDV